MHNGDWKEVYGIHREGVGDGDASVGLAMTAFYFDVGGVIIADHLAPGNALSTFKRLSKRQKFDPEKACATYLNLQHSLDLGTTSLPVLCSALRVEQGLFEQDWLAIHPADPEVVAVIERLLRDGHRVGLATNMCRRLLDLLIGNTPTLSRLTICCSSDVGCVKPSPAFFERAVEMMAARDMVFIDDRTANIDAARDFGWTPIHATNDWLPRFRERYVKER